MSDLTTGHQIPALLPEFLRPATVIKRRVKRYFFIVLSDPKN
ncbi:hypothetical protein [Burkholderia diffusa]|nr:hypothetical protein [Burkholderia diffusa]